MPDFLRFLLRLLIAERLFRLPSKQVDYNIHMITNKQQYVNGVLIERFSIIIFVNNMAKCTKIYNKKEIDGKMPLIYQLFVILLHVENAIICV